MHKTDEQEPSFHYVSTQKGIKQRNNSGKWIVGGIVLLLLTTGVAMADVVYSTHAVVSLDSTIIPIRGVLNALAGFPTKGDSLPVLIQFYDDFNQPEPGIPCTLSIGPTKLARTSDEDGEVLFWVPSAELSQEIELNAYPRHPVDAIYLAFLSRPTSFEMFVLKQEAGFLTGEGMLELADDGIRVLYPEGYDEAAADMMTVFQEEKEIIESAIGMGLLLFKAILVDSSSTGICVGGYGYPLLGTGSIFEQQIYDVFPHEWVEISLRANYGIYDDSTNRWIGDGLANYAAFEIRKQLTPQYFERFETRVRPEESGAVYDLRSWLSCDAEDQAEEEGHLPKGAGTRYVKWDGYQLAPYFWAKIVDKSGNPELIEGFLAEYLKQEDKSQQAAIAILSRLSGLDIDSELVITGEEFLANVNRYWRVIIPPPGMELIKTWDSFSMGDSSDATTSPVRKIRGIEPFFLDHYEVTNEQYCEFLNAMGNRKEKGARWLDEVNNPEIERVNRKYQVKEGYEKYPVRYVTWYGTNAYAQWTGKRLPTEAEWEFAASNNGTTLYPWDGNQWHDDYCNWGEGGELDGCEFTAPVDTFPKTSNHYDCLNMAGNVSEWVADWYSPYDLADTLNPQGSAEGTDKVHRGGSYNDDKTCHTTRARMKAPPSVASPYIGFRCAADVPKSKN